MQKLFTGFVILFLITGLAFADVYFEGATNGTLDLEWDYNTTTYVAGDTLVVVDSTGSAWGSHVLAFTDADYTGLVHLKDVVLSNYTIQADIYIVGEAVLDFPLYTGIGIKMAHDETKYYRFIFRNSTSSDHGQLRLQGYDGASWHISKYWNAGVDFEALKTGWHNFKIKVNGNKFWAYIDGKMLPGCPFEDTSPFLTEGYPGIFKYNTASGTVIFDNFKVQTPDLFFSEYIEGSSYNKALEIYNPTGAVVDLTNYQILQSVNGGGWQYAHTFPAGATLAAGDVWVICTNQTDVALFDTSTADEVLAYPSVTHHNGDDARALIKIMGTDTLWLDIFGDPDNDPGTAWEVAGVANGTAEHTLVRKESIFMGETDWMAAFGSDADNSEWVVYDQNTFDYLGAHPGMPAPEVVTVTLQFNSCTVLDTLGENGFVEVRGALNYNWATGPVLPGGKVISWDTSSDLDMTNVGGDYWTVTFEMYLGDTLKYKFWTGHTSDIGTYPNGGWEGPFDNVFADTRVLIASQSDTVVPVQYYNPDLGLGPQPQYKMPFEPKADTVAVYFRVNMGGEMEAERFDPTVHGPIGMRGDGGASGGTLDWDITKVLLNWEENSIYDGSFWSGVAYFAKDSVTEGATQAFKFFAENTPDFSWEEGSDHTFTYPVGLKDTTIHWTWFSGKKVTGVKPIESIITWRMSTEALEALGLFNRGVGDKIEIRGPRGWDAEDAVELFYQPLLQEWTSANENFKLPPGTEIFYKYFVDWDSSRFDETNPNYIAGLINTDGSTRGWEEPAITGGGNRTHVFQNATEQTAVGDFGFERQFFNSVPANGVFDHDLTVTWNVDMNNATNADSNAANADNLFRPGIDSVFIVWDGELLGVTQGHDMWGADNFLELTDMDGDMIYSGSYTITVSDKFPHGWYQLGYKTAYSTDEPGVYITNQGGGVERGRRYMQYIHPDQVLEGTPFPVTVWPTSFNLPVVPWRDTDLFVEYPPPDLTTPTAVRDNKIDVPFDYALEPNYPNPFNPSTTIKYTMAKGARVSIKVYNINGQLVATLIDTWQPQGHHFVKWLGKDDSGKDVTSGMYLVKMITGDFSKVNKMMLVR